MHIYYHYVIDIKNNSYLIEQFYFQVLVINNLFFTLSFSKKKDLYNREYRINKQSKKLRYTVLTTKLGLRINK